MLKLKEQHKRLALKGWFWARIEVMKPYEI